MDLCKIEDFSFWYPTQTKPALSKITLSIRQGEFLVLCGQSGCGKTTLLRHLKPELQPYGRRQGSILFEDQSIFSYPPAHSAASIGYVMQHPDHQIVCDQVWHELAFGLENLAVPAAEIRRKTAEISTYFGLSALFHRSCDALSGGQKQLLNLASILILQPKLLLLDEPTSQLDPIAASEFLHTLKKINEESGITIVLIEHRLEEAFTLADRIALMEDGALLCAEKPEHIAATLALLHPDHPMQRSFPTTVRLHQHFQKSANCPLTIKEGKQYLQDFLQPQPKHLQLADKERRSLAMELDNAHFRYERDDPEILKGCCLSLYQGEICMLLGENGAGKSTLLNILCGTLPLTRGSLRIFEKTMRKKANQQMLQKIAYVPQDPLTLFVKDCVSDDLTWMCQLQNDVDEANKQMQYWIEQFHIAPLLQQHPYDLSGGEQQKVALCKVLIRQPAVLLLDEPTKGLDAAAKEELARILSDLKQQGLSVLLVSHDIEFGAAISDQVALLFDGVIIAQEEPHVFFSGNAFYTTAAHKIGSSWFPNAITCEEVISLCETK